jgi:cell fate regulator YaaT (PSP1 superfamily)
MTQAIVGVRFKRAGKIYYFGAGDRDAELRVGDKVIADTQRGLELGRIVLAPGQIVDNKGLGRLKNITRIATEQDLDGESVGRELERKTVVLARDEIERLKLPMLAVQAEAAFDRSRVTLFFLSEEAQVDSRELVRLLAEKLQVRVNLRQVGPRDRAKMFGGIDRCGRELCCSTWITEFQPIQIRMAKNQQLPLNPSEISGVCGKLLCCLSFEDEQYSAMNKGLPKIGASLVSAVGRGRVTDVNVLTQQITISWETGSRITVAAEEFAEQQRRRTKAMGEGVPAAEALMEFAADSAPKRPAAPIVEELPPRLDGARRPERPIEARSEARSPMRPDVQPGRQRRGAGPADPPRPEASGRPGSGAPSGEAPDTSARPDGTRARNARRRRDNRRGGRGGRGAGSPASTGGS